MILDFNRVQFRIQMVQNRELTLKCKFKCYVKPIKDPLGVSPSKGNPGATRGKEKIHTRQRKNSV